MLKLIHGADFHLDSPFSGLTPEQAALRRSEQRRLLDDLADLAAERQADLVLLSGDLLDSDRVYRETAQALSRALGRIPCPVFIAPGNHDCCFDRSVYAQDIWPDNVHIFTSEEVEGAELPDLNCTVYGRAFTRPFRDESPLKDFRAPEDGRIHLMCLHGEVGGQGHYGPIAPADIAASGLDYLALGHIHQCSGLQREGDTHWAYPGCPEGRGFDETGEKGVLFVEVDTHRAAAQFIPLGRRKYEILTVDITGSDPLTAIRAALPGDTRQDTYRIILTGEGETPDTAALTAALAPNFFGLTVIDRTRLPADLWARREEDTLTGLFLRLMWDKCGEDPDDPIRQLATRFGLAALEKGEDAAP